MTTKLEVLTRRHKPLLKTFENQEKSLVTYLQRFALRHAEKDLLSRTYLAIDEHNGRLAGYFSLSTVSVERTSIGDIEGLSSLPHFPIPGVLLARLAVDTRVQGQGIGRDLFDEALELTLDLASNGPVMFRLFVTDAISEQAITFYSRLGFVQLFKTLPARMVLDLKPLIHMRKT